MRSTGSLACCRLRDPLACVACTALYALSLFSLGDQPDSGVLTLAGLAWSSLRMTATLSSSRKYADEGECESPKRDSHETAFLGYPSLGHPN